MSVSAGTAPDPLWPALSRLAAQVGAQTGWRRFGLSLLAGALSTAALPPISLVFCLIPAFVTLMWQFAASTNARNAFLIGWFFGVGHFIAGLYWVGIAMTVDFERFWWFLPISVLGLSCGLALFIGLVTWATWRSRLVGPQRLVTFVLLWLAMEWLRSWVLSGFPWNLIGTTWSEIPAMMQFASLTGVWGLTVISLLAAVSLAVLGEAERPRGGRALIALSWGLLLTVFLFGSWRLADAELEEVGPVVRLVQPSVPQTLKWNPSVAAQNLEQLLKLSRGDGFQDVTLVVWPETAVPFNLWREPSLLAAVSSAVPPGGFLVTGAPRYTEEGTGFNALHVIAEDATIVETYDKVHLVPFGEYVPLGDFLGGLNIAVARGGLSSGPGLTTLELPGLPAASPLICYEVIFPGAVTDPEGPRPGFLLNLTNDAWFGHSSGPYQHFASAKMRAVEEGLPLVRAANNGISAMVDPYGRVIGHLDLDEIGVLDAPLPVALSPTLFAQLGNWMLIPLTLLLGLLAWLFGQVQARR